MTEIIRFNDVTNFDDELTEATKSQALTALEDGQVLFFSHLGFKISEPEQQFLTEASLDGSRKNIGYDSRINRLHGDAYQGESRECLRVMIQRYVAAVEGFIDRLLPQYKNALVTERTTFRPAKVEGRKVSSYRKDDSRLHVDAFPSSPLQGKRSMRVFTNINPQQIARVWRVGESFSDLIQRFKPLLRTPMPGFNQLLKLCKVTKSLRSDYDSLMLQLHDKMKHDQNYQQTVAQQTIEFPPGSTWIVFSDQVSHAAMSGQFLLEQTFQLPVEAMQHPEKSPLKQLEALFQRQLSCA